MQLAELLLNWYQTNGRFDLPWRQTITAYRVWLSEIMLQQTQVKTVLPYFEKFMTQYPTLSDLANAELDQVLYLWTGLGYYSRARLLYKTANIVQSQYGGEFPADLNELEKLPGIGRSTAGAILAISFKKKAAILDGNVKRILTRLFAIENPIDDPASIKLLWHLAQTLLPDDAIDAYTQASMDLGAMICTRRKPKCDICPWQSACLALQKNLQETLPIKKKKKPLPYKKIHMLIFQNEYQEILLEKRNEKGIWGNLWSFPECAVDVDIALQTNYVTQILTINMLEAFRHTFTHFHLDITPLIIQVKKDNVIFDANRLWYADDANLKLGMPTPVVKLINHIFKKD